MPTYEYACKECEKHLEVQQSFSDDALTVCPSCGGPLRKVFGNIAITFKGSGFYKNDSRSSSSATKTPDAKPGEAKSDAKSDTSSGAATSSEGTGTKTEVKKSESSSAPAAAAS